jgi:hypothetical protein
MKNTIVVDLDGTLANLDHRLPLIKGPKKHWDKFYSLVAGDRVNEWCASLMQEMNRAHNVVIVSARPMIVKEATEKWLSDNRVRYGVLYLLRKDSKDFTPDTELKRNWLKWYGKDNILFTVDDRQRVVDMWREEGVICLQCNAWKEDKKSSRTLSLPELAEERGYKVEDISLRRPINATVYFRHPNAYEKAQKFLLRKKKIGESI